MAILWGLATPTFQRIWLVAVSIAETWLVPKPATSTMLPSGVIARPCGVWPTSMLLVTLSLLVSMTLTVEAPSLLTYTQRPSGVTTMPCGPVGTGIVERIWLDPVSNTATAVCLNNPTDDLGAGADCAAATGLYASAYALLPASSKAVMVARRHPRGKRECSMSVYAPWWWEQLVEDERGA